jgi:hypothetical protein
MQRSLANSSSKYTYIYIVHDNRAYTDIGLCIHSWGSWEGRLHAQCVPVDTHIWSITASIYAYEQCMPCINSNISNCRYFVTAAAAAAAAAATTATWVFTCSLQIHVDYHRSFILLLQLYHCCTANRHASCWSRSLESAQGFICS